MGMLDLIADPVRLRIVRRLARDGAASLQELADAAGVHVNTARAHVGALEDGGAVVARPRDPQGRGRPGVEYALREGWTIPSEDFLGVAEVLAAALARAGASTEELRELGRDWGRYVLGRPGPPQDAEEQIVRALERFGHVATIEGDTVHLAGCPCPVVAPDCPRLVCDLAAGVVEGVLEGSGSRLRVSRRSHDPEARSCELALTTRRGGR